MERDRDNVTPEKSPREMFVDERTRAKIHKHLSDPNDEITEEDIANVNTDIYARPATEEEEREIDEQLDEEQTKKAPSAWDVSTDE
jgi:hypothetical protein